MSTRLSLLLAVALAGCAGPLHQSCSEAPQLQQRGLDRLAESSRERQRLKALPVLADMVTSAEGHGCSEAYDTLASMCLSSGESGLERPLADPARCAAILPSLTSIHPQLKENVRREVVGLAIGHDTSRAQAEAARLMPIVKRRIAPVEDHAVELVIEACALTQAIEDAQLQERVKGFLTVQQMPASLFVRVWYHQVEEELQG